MNKLILLLVVLSPLTLWAQSVSTPTLTSEVDNKKPFSPRESHWLVSLGTEQIKYQVPFEFAGTKKQFKPNEREMWGGRLGLGREFYLGAGFMTATKIEGYYLGTAFSKIESANPDVNIDYAFTKHTGQMKGGDITQSLSYLFNFKTKNPLVGGMAYLTIEPFIEAGVGRAQAFNKFEYFYNTGPAVGSSQVHENYRETVIDDLITQKYGLGVNMTANSGFFFYMKATQNRLSVISRSKSGLVRDDDGLPSSYKTYPKNVNLSPVMIYGFGGGYKF